MASHKELESPQFRILDGGSATELVRLGHKAIDKDPLWSSRLLQTEPGSIVKAHKNFLEVGSDLIVTVTYQASVEGFQEHLGVSEQGARDLIGSSVRLARQACQEVGQEKGVAGEATVAGSVGPYGAVLHDGSEYTGNYAEKMTTEELVDFHRPRVQALLEAGADILAVETMPIPKEAEAVVQLLREFPNSKYYVSYMCKNGDEVAHGERFSEAVRSVVQSDQVVAVGINCTHPKHISPLLKSIQHLDLSKPVLVKPNSGEDWTPNEGWYGRASAPLLSSYVKEWIDLGAKWIGGCCRITPSDIADLRKVISDLQEERATVVMRDA
ncbi:hypothetical protein ScPMuIL_017844 [Solemya velum]